MSCNYNCRSGNAICKRAIYSTGVSVVTVAGTDTLVIDIPAGTYYDGCQYCLFIVQTIPATATRYMPVAISIGGVTTTIYPLVRCDCAQVTQCAIENRCRYRVRVSTSGTGGVFKVLSGLSCAPSNALASLPAPTATTPTPANAAVVRSATAFAPKKASTKASTVDNLTVKANNVTVNKEEI